jgi:phosphatidylserine/phosphatidylglycerophosphate/cardiolipin synthase-like enzyme
MLIETADPSKRFLADRQNPDSDLSIYTSGNDVRALIDGASYFRMVHELISATTDQDVVCLASWRLDRGQELLPGDNTSRIEQVLNDAHRRGVNVRVLLSNHLTQRNSRICHYLRKAGVPVIRDSRHPRLGSAHQKLLIISHGGVLSAFCGGIDIAHRRWDQPPHPAGGWHDVQCYIRGPACLDLYKTFQERWNDRREPRNRKSPPPHIEDPPSDAPKVGTHHVQVLRTYANRQGYPFAPMGEFTARRACLKAIGLAQRYVYIEDQYFVSSEVADALEIALRTRPNLRIIVVVPEAPSIFLRPFVARQTIRANIRSCGN